MLRKADVFHEVFFDTNSAEVAEYTELVGFKVIGWRTPLFIIGIMLDGVIQRAN